MFSFSIFVIAFTALLLVMAGCQTQAARLEEKKAIARRALEEPWNQGNLDVVDETVASDWVQHEPGMEYGAEALKEFITAYRAAFPDLHYTIEDEIAEGDKVVTRWIATGSHQGELMGIPPTGKQIAVWGIAIDRLEGGKIVESWVVYDQYGMLQQLGVIPSPGEGED